MRGHRFFRLSRSRLTLKPAWPGAARGGAARAAPTTKARADGTNTRYPRPVAEDTRPPVAIRSLRPYATEEAFLAEERDTLTRTAITLIGAPSRPRGVVIRFELTLGDGTVLVRGEGRVLGFQPADEHGPQSLTLRFTRLDAKSKALIDRAAELREAAAGRPSEALTVGSDTEPPVASAPSGEEMRTVPPGAPSVLPGAIDSRATQRPDPVGLAPADLVRVPSTEPPPASEEHIALSISSGNLPLMEVEEIGATLVPAPLVQADSPSGDEPAAESVRRDSLLDRLRTRAKTLSPTQVATILTPRVPS